jgi:hypothetical protein
MKLLMIGVVIFFSIGIYFARQSEKRKWNNGICPLCNSDLILHPWMMDSQGGRGWTCRKDDCGYTAWVSYNVDKKVTN